MANIINQIVSLTAPSQMNVGAFNVNTTATNVTPSSFLQFDITDLVNNSISATFLDGSTRAITWADANTVGFQHANAGILDYLYNNYAQLNGTVAFNSITLNGLLVSNNTTDIIQGTLTTSNYLLGGLSVTKSIQSGASIYGTQLYAMNSGGSNIISMRTENTTAVATHYKFVRGSNISPTNFMVLSSTGDAANGVQSVMIGTEAGALFTVSRTNIATSGAINTFSIVGTTASTSISTGSLVVGGGAGFAGACYVGNGLNISGATTTLAPSTTTYASLLIPSGVAPTTPSAGMMWQDGTNLFYATASTSRTVMDMESAQSVIGAKKFSSSTILINNPAATFAYTLVTSAITATRNLTLPLITANDTVAVLGLAQTFSTAQTFTASPVLNGGATISGTTAAATKGHLSQNASFGLQEVAGAAATTSIRQLAGGTIFKSVTSTALVVGSNTTLSTTAAYGDNTIDAGYLVAGTLVQVDILINITTATTANTIVGVTINATTINLTIPTLSIGTYIATFEATAVSATQMLCSWYFTGSSSGSHQGGSITIVAATAYAVTSNVNLGTSGVGTAYMNQIRVW